MRNKAHACSCFFSFEKFLWVRLACRGKQFAFILFCFVSNQQPLNSLFQIQSWNAIVYFAESGYCSEFPVYLAEWKDIFKSNFTRDHSKIYMWLLLIEYTVWAQHFVLVSACLIIAVILEVKSWPHCAQPQFTHFLI